MRSLTIDGRIFAEAEIQSVALHPVVGAYELRFGLNIVAMPEIDGWRFRAVFDSIRIRVKAGSGQYDDLGFAYPESRVEIETKKFSNRITRILSLPLQYSQINAMDTLRGTDDLCFEILVNGRGFTQIGENVIKINNQQILHRIITRSDWIATLRMAGARNILIFEVPLRFPNESGQSDSISEDMLRADSQFQNGDYHGCIATCRTILQELGYRKSGKKGWANLSLDQFGSERTKMSKTDRDLAVLAALRHVTHLAHHAQSEGGEDRYTRDDAWHVFSLTASFVARWMPQ